MKFKLTCLALIAAIVTACGSSDDDDLIADDATGQVNDDGSIKLPSELDYMGPTVKTLTVNDGRSVAYVDTGPEDGTPVLFISGTGTSAAAVGLTDYLRTFRQSLDLRLISVGRAGFGQSDPAENWTFDDYANDASDVLAELGVEDVSVIAISGGGPYAAAFASAGPDRIRSVHLAAASALVTRSALCDDGTSLQAVMDNYAAHPLEWWAFPDASPTHDIPGFGTAAADDGARTFSIAGQQGSGAAEVAEIRRYCDLTLADVSGVSAPVYIYQGLQDTTVGPENADLWESVFPNIAFRRNYPDGGHDVQYRHWDQVLVDMAGLGDSVIVCDSDEESLVSSADAINRVADGASLGLCLWGNDDD